MLYFSVVFGYSYKLTLYAESSDKSCLLRDMAITSNRISRRCVSKDRCPICSSTFFFFIVSSSWVSIQIGANKTSSCQTKKKECKNEVDEFFILSKVGNNRFLLSTH